MLNITKFHKKKWFKFFYPLLPPYTPSSPPLPVCEGMCCPPLPPLIILLYEGEHIPASSSYTPLCRGTYTPIPPSYVIYLFSFTPFILLYAGEHVLLSLDYAWKNQLQFPSPANPFANIRNNLISHYYLW